jgi:hypothetical protein
MIRPEFRKKLERQHTILLLVWAAFVHAVFLYLWMTNFMLSRSSVYGLSEAVRVALWLISVIEIGLLFFWKSLYLNKQAILSRALKAPVTSSLAGYESPQEQRAAEVVSSYFLSKLTALALAEAVAISGFVLAFIGGYLWDQYVLSLLSGVLLLLQFPSKDFLEELTREVELHGG